jgi:hypothetical protein
LTPTVIEDVPQNETEGATTNHIKGGIYFGLERGGESYGGALPGENCSEICWFYGHAGQAQYWVSAHGPPHTEPPFSTQFANLNWFATFDEEDGFYEASKQLQRKGEHSIKLWLE